ncbi:SLBB domain-containing protein [Aquirufa sp. OSTEICH-129V]|uniref:SLBB domain-containing protein n=1 Tax=Aquirufa avitistagni TaxID=3104728 RepID=A0ABW6D8N3_9BACT
MKFFQKANKSLFLAFSLICLLAAHLATAQQVTQPKRSVDELSDEEIALFMERAQASGMSETQIEQAAKTQGYSAADIAKMRSRIAMVQGIPTSGESTGETAASNDENDPFAKNNARSLSEMGSGKSIPKTGKISAKGIANISPNVKYEIDEKGRKVYLNAKGEEIDAPLTLQERKILNAPLDIYNDSLVAIYKRIQKKVANNIDKNIFGSTLFNNELMTFEPNLRIATPKNYQLGPEDELNIAIFGDVLDNFKVKVSPEGTVKILNIAPIYVNGLTIEVASERIISRLRQLYQGLNKPGSGSSAQVTLGNVRSIKVTITGEAQMPGTYTVSSLSTIFNALYLAGGPSKNGSYRSIKLIRGNKIIRTLDLYDFLLKADQTDNIHLNDQDVIRISDYENRVEVSGEVKRPMTFEMTKGETFKDLLKFAGGFTEKAYTYTINVRRNTSREIKLLNITQGEVENFLTQNGDKYTIGQIIERYENRIELEGAVFRPGMYALENGLSTIKELFKKAEGVREDAFLNRATITRKKENFDPEIISFDLGKVLRGEVADIPLQREDVIKVFSVKNLREKRVVNITGEVNQPGEFDYKEGMKVADLILLAKGLKESASFSNLELARRIINHGANQENANKIEIINFEIDGDLKISNKGSQLVLQPFDIISIRRAPSYEEQRSVKVLGMVNYPGSYAIQTNKQKISDVLERAGGLRIEGYLEGAKLLRNGITVGVNLKEVLSNPNSQENLQLMAGDELMIPRLLQTVKLNGAVQNPLAVSYKESFTLKDYVAEAGGYSILANKKQIYVTYANGVSNQIRKFLIFKKNPRIEPGAEITIPALPESSKKGLTAAEAIGLTSSFISVALTLITLINNLPK